VRILELCNVSISVTYLGIDSSCAGKEEASCKVNKDEEVNFKLIPKPKGLAGRSPPKGYNLQDAMGLSGNKARYNKISVRYRLYAQVMLHGNS
jgi:hypothetical protein